MHHLNSMFNRKLFQPITLNLIPGLIKMLSHLITLYPPCLVENNVLVTTLNLVPSLLKKVITSCHTLSRLATPYHTLSPTFDRKIILVTTLNLVPNLLKKLSHLVTPYRVLSHITPYFACFIEN